MTGVMKRALRWGKNGLLGAMASQVLPLSIVTVGWVQRLMQRETLRTFERLGEGSLGLDPDPALREALSPPRWLSGGTAARGWRRPLGGLAANVRLGLASILNTWALTLPGASLWLFSWYDGWNNSFHKGYEQAAVGPLTGLLGVALFIAAMLYVPMAQARQASTGSWRGFWDVGLVRELVRRRWWGCLRLAAAYALLGVPVVALKTAPIAFDRVEAWASASDAELLQQLQTYFFYCGLFIFLAYVWLRRAAARLYADALCLTVRAGAVSADALGPIERAALDRLGLLGVAPEPDRHMIVRAARTSTAWLLRSAAIGAAVVVWFAFVSEIYVSEFLNHHPVSDGVLGASSAAAK